MQRHDVCPLCHCGEDALPFLRDRTLDVVVPSSPRRRDFPKAPRARAAEVARRFADAGQVLSAIEARDRSIPLGRILADILDAPALEAAIKEMRGPHAS